MLESITYDKPIVLAEQAFAWEFGHSYSLQIIVRGNQILPLVDGALLSELEAEDGPLSGGGVALIPEEGRIGTEEVCVRPVVEGRSESIL